MKKTFAIFVLLFFSLNIIAFAQEPTISEVNHEPETEIALPEIIDLEEDEFIEGIITPESDIYAIKRLFEEIQGYFYSLDSQKLEYFVNLAEKRLDEIEAFGSEEEKLEYLEALIEDFLSNIAASEEIAENIVAEDEDYDTNEDLEEKDKENNDETDEVEEVEEVEEIEEVEEVEEIKEVNLEKSKVN